LAAVACSSTTTASTSTGSTPGGTGGGGGAAVDTAGLENVNIPFSADMQVPDPDIFYEVEGNAITTSVYEGLVRYKQDSADIEPWMAESYTVSPDGLTYTFKIRANVKFHDGTPLDAAAA